MALKRALKSGKRRILKLHRIRRKHHVKRHIKRRIRHIKHIIKRIRRRHRSARRHHKGKPKGGIGNMILAGAAAAILGGTLQGNYTTNVKEGLLSAASPPLPQPIRQSAPVATGTTTTSTGLSSVSVTGGTTSVSPVVQPSPPPTNTANAYITATPFFSGVQIQGFNFTPFSSIQIVLINLSTNVNSRYNLPSSNSTGGFLFTIPLSLMPGQYKVNAFDAGNGSAGTTFTVTG